MRHRPLGGSSSTADSINDNGQIVGTAKNMSNQNRAVLFDPTGNGNNIDLGAGQQSAAYSINNHNQLVRHTDAPLFRNTTAALFDPTGGGNNIYLNNLIDPTLGWDLRTA